MIFASGSLGCVQSSLDPFFGRLRSKRANSARVGVAMPDAAAQLAQERLVTRARIPAQDASKRRIGFQRRRVDADRLAPTRPASASRCSTQVKTARCVSTSIRRRVRDTVEWSGGAASSDTSRNCHRLSESAARHAIARSESRPSK